jgi:hypothetical protein
LCFIKMVLCYINMVLCFIKMMLCFIKTGVRITGSIAVFTRLVNNEMETVLAALAISTQESFILHVKPIVTLCPDLLQTAPQPVNIPSTILFFYHTFLIL